jgi:hypothetical protein
MVGLLEANMKSPADPSLKRLATLALLAAAAAPQAASASLIYDSRILVTGQGFGNNPRLLTLQETGNGDDVESGCVGVSGGISFGSCTSDGSVFQGNGFTNAGGDEVNPRADNQKFGIPTLGELGFDDAGDIGLLFNATEPGGNGVTINDVTLKFLQGDTLLAAIDGNHTFDSTNPGNGVAGFTFVVDDTQQDFLDNAIFSLPNFGDIRIALESTISNAQGGPESWLAFNLNRSNPVPAPGAVGLFALGLGAIGLRLGRRKQA